MMHSKIKTRKWQYALLLPLIGFALLLFSFQPYPVYLQTENGNTTFQDSLPPLPTDAENTVYDTIIVFNPETGKESIHIVESKGNRESSSYKYEKPRPVSEIDTVIVFDPETLQESIYIVKDGVVDTLR